MKTDTTSKRSAAKDKTVRVYVQKPETRKTVRTVLKDPEQRKILDLWEQKQTANTVTQAAELFFNEVAKRPEAEQRSLLHEHFVKTKDHLRLLEGSREETTFEDIKVGYTPYPKGQKMTVENITAHLKDQLGDYLTAFGAPEDLIYLDQLRKIEPLTDNLYSKLQYENRKDKSSPIFTDFVPKKTERITKEIENIPYIESQEQLKRLCGVQRSRITRSSSKQVLEALIL